MEEFYTIIINLGWYTLRHNPFNTIAKTKSL